MACVHLPCFVLRSAFVKSTTLVQSDDVYALTMVSADKHMLLARSDVLSCKHQSAQVLHYAYTCKQHVRLLCLTCRGQIW